MILMIDFLCIFVLCLFVLYQSSTNRKLKKKLAEQKRINKELSVKILQKQMELDCDE